MCVLCGLRYPNQGNTLLIYSNTNFRGHSFWTKTRTNMKDKEWFFINIQGRPMRSPLTSLLCVSRCSLLAIDGIDEDGKGSMFCIWGIVVPNGLRRLSLSLPGLPFGNRPEKNHHSLVSDDQPPLYIGGWIGDSRINFIPRKKSSISGTELLLFYSKEIGIRDPENQEVGNALFCTMGSMGIAIIPLSLPHVKGSLLCIQYHFFNATYLHTYRK